jgi:ParB family transcriptional regulator, chromosome partitioning protein
MTNIKRGLGKGLADLGINELLSEIKSSGNKSELRKLPVDVIQPGKYQPRKDIDHEALDELAKSIKAQGIIQPILVRSIKNGQYEIVAGERRWRAAQLAGLQDVPAVIREMPDETAIALSLIENIQREDLNVIEEATALQRLIDEFTMTHQEVADAVGKSRTTITNLLRLLNLRTEIKTMLQHGDLEMGHARALLALNQNLQLGVAQQIVNKNLSVRETEALVNRLQQPNKKIISKALDPDIASFQKRISDQLAARVMIQHTKNGAGKMIIRYNSLDELEGIMRHIK